MNPLTANPSSLPKPKPAPLAARDPNQGSILTAFEPNKAYSIAEGLAEIAKHHAAEAQAAEQLTCGANDANLDKDDDDDEMDVPKDCDQVRRLLEIAIEDSGMDATSFIRHLQLSKISYKHFMKQRGKDKGRRSQTYLKAVKFFEEHSKIKNAWKKHQTGAHSQPKRRKIAATETSASSASPQNKRAAANTPVPSFKAGATTASAAAGMIELEDETEDAVEVYDSCDEIRSKIFVHLRRPGVTRGQFLRDLQAQFHGPRKPKSLQSTQLNKFLEQNGPVTGNTSGIYYAAYVFFEKERLAAGLPKTEHREDMEDAWGLEGGVNVKTNLNNISYVTSVHRQLYIDDLGKPYSV